MTRSYVPLLLLLASIWGASYLLIKVGIRDFEPTTLMSLRMLLAFVPLFAFLCFRRGSVRRAAGDLRATARAGFLLGLAYGAIPFTLIAWGEKHVDSGVAAIANSTVPIFVVLLAIRFKPSERVSGLRLLGVGIGLVGVAILVGVHPRGGWWAVAGTLAVVLSSLSFACGGLYGQTRAGHADATVLATTSMLCGGLVLLPFGVVQMPGHVPGWKPIAALLALAFVGTALAQLILYRLLGSHGASKTALVAYLLPALALFYGALILGEPVTASALGGLAVILAGVALGSGVLRDRFRRPAAAPAP